jgi:hypothetical protein
MNLANGVHEFFFKRISHVRALHILKSALRGCEPAARGFIGWHGYLKVMARAFPAHLESLGDSHGCDFVIPS